MKKQNVLDFFCKKEYYLLATNAGVMELADVLDSKSSGSDTVPVRPRSPAPEKTLSADKVNFFIRMFFT